MQPKYIYKIYDITDTFVKVLDDVISKPEFTYSLNGGLGELVLQLNRSLDDYGEGTDLDFNYKVEVHLTDDYNDSALIYTGYISAFNPYYRNGSEGVEITILPNIAKLNNEYYRSGTSVKDNFDLTWTATEIGDIIEGIIDNHRSLVSALYISNDYTDIDDTGNSITVTFSQEKHIDTIHLLEKYIDTGWHWYIDASGKFYLKDQSATADHSFILGKHIIGIDGHKNIEDVMNTYFIWNGEKSGTVVDNIYQDATSQNNFDNIAGLLVDSEMTTDGFSDFTGNAKIANNKDSKRLITITISAKDYDIAGIRPGDTCKILNIDGNQTIFGTNMKIYRIDYTPTEATLELIGVDLKPVLSTDSKSNDVKSVGGVTAQMVREATVKANAGMHWDGDVLVIEGSIKAVTGEIGGWVIGTDTLSSVDGDIVLDSSTGAANLSFYDGSANLAGKLYGEDVGGPVMTVGAYALRILPQSNSNDGELILLGVDAGGTPYAGNIKIHHRDSTGGETPPFYRGDLEISSGNNYPAIAHTIWINDCLVPTDTVRTLGMPDSSYMWGALYLAQLGFGYPATEGAVFTKDDHHIYYRNNTGEVQLDTTDPVGTYLPLAGGTMTGEINMGTYSITNANTATFSNPITVGTPTAAGHAVTSGYLTTALASYLALSGGTMTGEIAMGNHKITGLATPVNDTDAATQGYVKSSVSAYLPLAGGTMTGDINMGTYSITNANTATFSNPITVGTPTAAGHAVTSGYLTTALASYLALSGGTMTGDINMGTKSITNANTATFSNPITVGTPTNNGHAATKEYVDDFLPLAGGTMTGALTVSSGGFVCSGGSIDQTDTGGRFRGYIYGIRNKYGAEPSSPASGEVYLWYAYSSGVIDRLYAKFSDGTNITLADNI